MEPRLTNRDSCRGDGGYRHREGVDDREGGRGPEELVSLRPAVAPSVIASVAFSPDGTRVLTADADGTVAKIWDVSISGERGGGEHPATLHFSDVAFMPDGVHVAR